MDIKTPRGTRYNRLESTKRRPLEKMERCPVCCTPAARPCVNKHGLTISSYHAGRKLKPRDFNRVAGAAELEVVNG